MKAVDAELWDLVDRRLDEMRRLPREELLRRAAAVPEAERLERESGVVRRSTRVVVLPNERVGISVRVDTPGRRGPLEGGVVITSTGELAPEWSQRGAPPMGNPFAFKTRTIIIAGTILVLMLLAFLLFVEPPPT